MSETIQSTLDPSQSRYQHFLSVEPVERKCPFCGRDFLTNIPKKVYCNRSCKEQEDDRQRKQRKQFEQRSCKHCGNVFVPWHHKHVFCSRICKQKYRYVLPTSRLCASCNKPFILSSNKGLPIYCSDRCYRDSRNKQKRERWRDDPVYVSTSKATSSDYQKRNCESIRQQHKEHRRAHPELRERARRNNLLVYDWMVYMLGNECDWCGSQRRMELDHIKPQGNYHSGVNQRLKDFYARKIRILCHDCHVLRHKGYMLSTLWNELPELYYIE